VPGIVGIQDIIAMLQRGERLKGRISDHVVGMVKIAVHLGLIFIKDADLFESPFCRGVKIRSSVRQHLGKAFFGPDNLLLRIPCRRSNKTVQLLPFRGDYLSAKHIPASPFTFDTVQRHPNYTT